MQIKKEGYSPSFLNIFSTGIVMRITKCVNSDKNTKNGYGD